MPLEVWSRHGIWYAGTQSNPSSAHDEIRGQFPTESDARKFAAADALLTASKNLLDAWRTKSPLAWQPDHHLALLAALGDAIRAAEPKPPTPTTEDLVGIIRELVRIVKASDVHRLYAAELFRADAVLRAAKGGVA